MENINNDQNSTKGDQNILNFGTEDTTQATLSSQVVDNVATVQGEKCSQDVEIKGQGLPTPANLASKNPKSKLNIIFDIDHTLIFTLLCAEFPQKGNGVESILEAIEIDPKIDPSWNKRVHKIVVNNVALFLFVRFGVPEMLEYLSTFCNFYVYSHGLRPYIDEILKVLDPDEKYFKNRNATVLAPLNQIEQF